MKTARSAILVASLLAAGFAPAQAQETGGSCILAGRLGDAGWAPRLHGVELLGADGQVVTGADRSSLAGIRQVRLSAPALLSRCDGNQELARGESAPGRKMPVPAVGPGLLEVQSVNYPRLSRGGTLVELRVAVVPEQVTMVTR